MRDDKPRRQDGASRDDMRLWPNVLKRNAAVIDLAAAIYKARGEAFGGSTDLSGQPAHIRQDYITRADELLKTLQPREPARVAPSAAVRSLSGHDFSQSLARNLRGDHAD